VVPVHAVTRQPGGVQGLAPAGIERVPVDRLARGRGEDQPDAGGLARRVLADVLGEGHSHRTRQRHRAFLATFRRAEREPAGDDADLAADPHHAAQEIDIIDREPEAFALPQPEAAAGIDGRPVVRGQRRADGGDLVRVPRLWLAPDYARELHPRRRRVGRYQSVLYGGVQGRAEAGVDVPT
jgi:hypothetical protein